MGPWRIARFPLIISAASDTGPDAPKRQRGGDNRLSCLRSGRRCWLLGEHFGLRSAMMVVLGLVMVAALVARAVAKPHK